MNGVQAVTPLAVRNKSADNGFAERISKASVSHQQQMIRVAHDEPHATHKRQREGNEVNQQPVRQRPISPTVEAKPILSCPHALLCPKGSFASEPCRRGQLKTLYLASRLKDKLQEAIEPIDKSDKLERASIVMLLSRELTRLRQDPNAMPLRSPLTSMRRPHTRKPSWLIPRSPTQENPAASRSDASVSSALAWAPLPHKRLRS